ncbi:hypothetical protein [Ralstonia pseudosolanacearum]|uniref:hypothetical protein n=1 Tax=Ralstonia pseudosolanacearum TaxID=1310165 RepID=UPI001FFB7CCF|nr:hypothetical protein [Ralstonia pseudosolanacearum]
MSNEAQANKGKPSVGRRVGKFVVFNMIPGYPVYKALKAAKDTAGTGAATVHDLVAELERRKPQRKIVRTYREALALRTPESLPLKAIAQSCLNRKRVCLAVVTIALAYAVGGAIGGSYLTAFIGLLAFFLPALFAVQFEHQLWQLDTGPLRPDEPLGGFSDFFQSKGSWLRLVSPHLSR